MEDNILAFMARRPEYIEQHVRDIALECDYEAIPFCSECADWHNKDEDHTED